MENRFVVLSLLEDLLHWPTPPPDDFSTEQPLQDDGRDENLLSAGSASDHNEEPRSRQRARCHAVMHMAALAKKMGPRWTGSEVVPYLLRCTEEEDAELAAAVAHVLPALVTATTAADTTTLVPLELALPILDSLACTTDEHVRHTLCLQTIPQVFFGCPFPCISSTVATGISSDHAKKKSESENDSHTMLVELAALQHRLAVSRGSASMASVKDRVNVLLALLRQLLVSEWAYSRSCAIDVAAYTIFSIGSLLVADDSGDAYTYSILTRPLLPRSSSESAALRNELIMSHLRTVANSSGIDVKTAVLQLLVDAGTFAHAVGSAGRARHTSRLRISVDGSFGNRSCLCAAIEALPLLAAGGVMPPEDALMCIEDVCQQAAELALPTEDFRVAGSLLGSIAKLCSLAPANVTDSLLSDVLHSLPGIVGSLFTSRAWKVRFVAARRFCCDIVEVIFSTIANQGLGHTRVVLDALRVMTAEPPLLHPLFSDCEEEVRAEVAAVAGNLIRHGACAAAGSPMMPGGEAERLFQLLTDQVLGSLQCAVVDESDRVRGAAATSLATVALALGGHDVGGTGSTTSSIDRATNMLLDLVRDDHMVVQLAVIGEISNVLSHGSIAARIQTELLSMCRGLAQHANWRTRESYAKVLVNMCQHFLAGSGHHSQASAFAASELLPLLVDMLFDKAHAVRACAAACTVAMCGTSDYLRELVWSAAKSSSKALATYQARMTLLQLGIKLRLDVCSVLQPLFDQLGRDPVANVRMVVAKELGALLCRPPIEGAGPIGAQEKAAMLPLLRLLMEDGSADVRECAAAALEKCF